MNNWRTVELSTLGLSKRAMRIADYGYRTLGDVIEAGAHEILSIPRIGPHAFTELDEALKHHDAPSISKIYDMQLAYGRLSKRVEWCRLELERLEEEQNRLSELISSATY